MITPSSNQKTHFNHSEEIKKQIEMSSFPKELAERIQTQRPVINNGHQPADNGQQKPVKKNFFAAFIARIARALAWLFGSKTPKKPLELPEPVSPNIPPPPPLPPKKAQKSKETTPKDIVKPAPQDPNPKAPSEDIAAHLKNALEIRRRAWESDEEDEEEEERTPEQKTVEQNPLPKTDLAENMKPTPTTPPAPANPFDVKEAIKEAAPTRKNLLGEIAGFDKAALKKAEVAVKQEKAPLDGIYRSVMEQIDQRQL